MRKQVCKEILRGQSTPPLRISLHTEECQEQAFFSRIVCAAPGGMTGSMKKGVLHTNNNSKQTIQGSQFIKNQKI